MTRTASERAEMGAAYLDTAVPGWHDRIDLGRLDMAAGRSAPGGHAPACVLCQLSSPDGSGHHWYDNGLDEVGVGRWANDDEIVYGFLATGEDAGDDAGDEFAAEYALLTAAWTAEITRRREAADPRTDAA
jgi:hypothetical protein